MLFGGVVPEIASRAHVERILPVIDSTLKKAGVGLADLDAIAVREHELACAHDTEDADRHALPEKRWRVRGHTLRGGERIGDRCIHR